MRLVLSWGENDEFQLGLGIDGDDNARGDDPDELGALLPFVRFPDGDVPKAVFVGMSSRALS